MFRPPKEKEINKRLCISNRNGLKLEKPPDLDQAKSDQTIIM